MNKNLTPLTEEELIKFRKTQTNSERVVDALMQEFFTNDKSPIHLTEEDMIGGFKEFKNIMLEHLPHLF